MPTFRVSSNQAKYPPTFWLTLLLALGSLLMSGFNTYARSDKELSIRISVVESLQQSDRTSILRVEGKVDKVDSKVDRISDYLMPKTHR